MPAKSAKQERFMQAVAHNPAFAKKAGVPQSVGEEFTKGPKKFAAGGLYENIHAKRKRIAEGSGEHMRKPGSKGAPTTNDFKESAKTAKYKEGGPVKESKEMINKEVAFMKKQGAPKSMIKHEQAEMENMKPSRVKKYARGGGIESRGKTRGKMC
jgi:signal recognition particle GTPase